MVNRVVVGAHYGLRGWLAQRITALLMLGYTFFLVIVLLSLPHTYDSWRALFQTTTMRVFTLITLMGLYLHAWVGVRDILMDYVKPAGMRLCFEVLTILALVTYSVLSAQILWRV